MPCIQSGSILSSGQGNLVESGSVMSSGFTTPIESGAILSSGMSLTLETGSVYSSGQPSTFMDAYFHNPPGTIGGPGEGWTAGQGSGIEGICSNGAFQIQSTGTWVPIFMLHRPQPRMRFYAYGPGGGELTDYVTSWSLTRSLNAPCTWEVTLYDKDRMFAPVGGDFTELCNAANVSDEGAVSVYFQMEIHMPGGQVWKSPRLTQSDYDWAGQARRGPAVTLGGMDYSELLIMDEKWSAPDVDAGTMLNAGMKDTLERAGVTKHRIRTPDSIVPTQYHRTDTSPMDVVADMLLAAGCCVYYFDEDTFVTEPVRKVERPEWTLNSYVHLKAIRMAKSVRETKTRHFCDVAIEDGGYSKEFPCRGPQCVGLQVIPLGELLMTATPKPLRVEQGDLHTFSYLREGLPLGAPPPGGQFNGAGSGPTDAIRFIYEPTFQMQIGIGGGGIPANSLIPEYLLRVRGKPADDNAIIPYAADLRANAEDAQLRAKLGTRSERVFHQLLSSQAMSQRLVDTMQEIASRRTMPAEWQLYPVNPWMRPNTVFRAIDWSSRTDLPHYIESCTMSQQPRQAIQMSLQTTRRIVFA